MIYYLRPRGTIVLGIAFMLVALFGATPLIAVDAGRGVSKSDWQHLPEVKVQGVVYHLEKIAKEDQSIDHVYIAGERFQRKLRLLMTQTDLYHLDQLTLEINPRFVPSLGKAAVKVQLSTRTWSEGLKDFQHVDLGSNVLHFAQSPVTAAMLNHTVTPLRFISRDKSMMVDLHFGESAPNQVKARAPLVSELSVE